MSDLVDAISMAGAPYGLNLVAAVSVERHDSEISIGQRAIDVAPNARSIVLIGNGGGGMWAAFKQHALRNPGWWEREHPLDEYTQKLVETKVTAPLRTRGVHYKVIYPFVHSPRTLNFVYLGRVTGLTGPSIIGVSLHPQFGPWIAFRAALLVDEEIYAPGPAVNFNPCPSCRTRSCIKACPATAVSIERAWASEKCLAHRVEVEQDCINRCHARAACVIGPEHIYSNEELAYHQTRTQRLLRPWYEANIKRQS